MEKRRRKTNETRESWPCTAQPSRTHPYHTSANRTCKKILVQVPLQSNAGGWWLVVGRKKGMKSKKEKKRKEKEKKNGRLAAGGRGDESHLQLNFSRAIHVHLFSSTATRIFVRANILAAWPGDEVVVSSPLPRLTLFLSLSLLSSSELQTPRSHSWRANEVEKIKAVAGDH